MLDEWHAYLHLRGVCAGLWNWMGWCGHSLRSGPPGRPVCGRDEGSVDGVLAVLWRVGLHLYGGDRSEPVDMWRLRADELHMLRVAWPRSVVGKYAK